MGSTAEWGYVVVIGASLISNRLNRRNDSLNELVQLLNHEMGRVSHRRWWIYWGTTTAVVKWFGRK
jgi:hypothetical protein